MTGSHEFRLDERNRMVDEIIALARDSGDAGHRQLDARVLEAMRRVPRHEFVPAEWRYAAYDNRPVPIGGGQTISQPYIVALMTDLLRLKPGDKVLEVGTGCGYQAAVLAACGADVRSIEIVEPLARAAAETLRRLGIRVSTRAGDAYDGWPEEAPFDCIIVTAAPDHVPPALVQQLKPGGRMVIPVGKLSQSLMVVSKNADGSVATEDVLPVRFVPLTRETE
jgi:protein-L-isoaspartate(D-aspartate) O-methyltransferase